MSVVMTRAVTPNPTKKERKSSDLKRRIAVVPLALGQGGILWAATDEAVNGAVAGRSSRE
jgi:hypothetical protein